MLGKIVNDDKSKNQSSLDKKKKQYLKKTMNQKVTPGKTLFILLGIFLTCSLGLFRLFALIKTDTSCLTNKPLTSETF